MNEEKYETGSYSYLPDLRQADVQFFTYNMYMSILNIAD